MNHVALICDDKYALPTLVCIRSIILSTISEITVHVCTFGLNADNTAAFHQLSSEKVRVVVDVFSSDTYQGMLDRINQKSHVTPTALIKFELSNYFNELDRMLYIDSDIIVKKDLSSLFKYNVDDFYLAASYEFHKYLENKRYRFKKHWDRSFYFNSGVMLMNLKTMRDDKVSEKLWDFKLNKSKTTLMDQESLIAVCGENVLPLPIKWNFNPVFFSDEYLDDINKIFGTQYDTIEAMFEDVAVIHYVGKKDKPWVYSTARMRENWIKVYDSVNGISAIHAIPDNEKTEHSGAVKSIYKKYGSEGLVCYYKYRIKQKLLSK